MINFITKIKKKRLDILLVEKHFALSLKHAQALIMSKIVYVNKQIEFRPWILYDTKDSIEIRKHNLYVSRGGLKLASALKVFKLNIQGYICLDIGASTGGFTDCLLQNGAMRVYSVDVGKGQLDYKLKQDKRVTNIENLNFRYYTKSLINDIIDLVTIDVSFISLAKILPIVYSEISTSKFIIPLIKPQFELSSYDVKKGIVKNENLRQQAIQKIKNFACNIGFIVVAETSSSLKGVKGNLEHFILLKR
ncbi:MAG: TlyA family RNA methyltransferase [Endomicrobium sp.]|jgi:23S rRNA (cytidine1920-2'-O)/16S rRNA (cytidine1409-2'-O)-methyltransferase|nr:TlyA family RNA methyltransferase [Endomicrobium sp.]